MVSDKDKRKVRSFSLNAEEDKDILNKINEVDNISEYIKKLIREDITSGNALTKGQREEVKRIAMKMLNDKAIELKEEDIDDKIDKDAINILAQF